MIDQSCEKEHSVIVGVTCDDQGEYTYGAIKFTKGIHYQGIGIALAEDRLFNKPIVTTNFADAKEQIVDNETRRIVEIDQ